MNNNDIFNILDTYFTDLSNRGYRTYFDVYNIFILVEYYNMLKDPLYTSFITNDDLKVITQAITKLENNSDIIKITRPIEFVTTIM